MPQWYRVCRRTMLLFDRAKRVQWRMHLAAERFSELWSLRQSMPYRHRVHRWTVLFDRAKRVQRRLHLACKRSSELWGLRECLR